MQGMLLFCHFSDVSLFFLRLHFTLIKWDFVGSIGMDVYVDVDVFPLTTSVCANYSLCICYHLYLLPSPTSDISLITRSGRDLNPKGGPSKPIQPPSHAPTHPLFSLSLLSFSVSPSLPRPLCLSAADGPP